MLDMGIIKAMKRIKTEFNKINQSSIIHSLGYIIDLPDEDNIFEWNISIKGPKDTSYSNGLFYLKIIFPKDYPIRKPEVCFFTPIYHLNVNPNKPLVHNDNIYTEPFGHVSFSVTNWWKSETTMEELFIKLYSLFYLAGPISLYGIDRVEEYKNNRDLYEKKVKYFTNKYANPMKERKDYSDKDWDFSISDEEIKNIENDNNYIDVLFNINGTEKTVKCEEKELIKDVIKKLDIDPNREDLLVVFKNRKININKSLEDNEITNHSTAIIIYDVEFA